jgi:hypothetical protein
MGTVKVVAHDTNTIADFKDTGSAPTVTYSDVDGGYTGTGNINAFPGFVNESLTQDTSIYS